jgi:hypothetical protein
VFQQDILGQCYQRLRRLQALYFEGQILWGSPEHFEILLLEEMESLLVQQEMRRFYECKSGLADGSKAADACAPAGRASLSFQIYRAARRRVRGKPERGQTAELVRLIRAADIANRAAYDDLRNSGLDQEAAEMLLSAGHLRRTPTQVGHSLRS